MTRRGPRPAPVINDGDSIPPSFAHLPDDDEVDSPPTAQAVEETPREPETRLDLVITVETGAKIRMVFADSQSLFHAYQALTVKAQHGIPCSVVQGDAIVTITRAILLECPLRPLLPHMHGVFSGLVFQSKQDRVDAKAVGTME